MIRSFYKLRYVILMIIASLTTTAAMAFVDPPASAAVNGPFTITNPYQKISVDDGITQSGVSFRSVADVVSLRIKDNVMITSNFSYYVKVKISAYADLGANTVPTVDTRTLQVSYDKTQGTSYKTIDSYNFLNARKIAVEIIEAGPLPLSTSPMPSAGMVELRATITVDRADTFLPLEVISVNPPVRDITASQLHLSWNHSSGAQEYDLEWTTLDDGDVNANVASGAKNNLSWVSDDQVAALFKNNASRVSTAVENCDVSLINNDDYLVVRVRAVQYTADGIRKLGNWTYKDKTGKYLALGTTDNWHQSNMNWQYTSVFAEEGKKKEVISYFDGSARSRQTVTIDNSTKVPVVQESVFDPFGRAAATILPAPVKDNGVLKPYLHYFQALNRNGAGTAYSYTDVIGSGSASCDFNPLPMSTGQGTSRYFSPLNDFNNDAAFQSNSGKYIPDAEGYPLAVTQYTPDNTGRIKLQGGVGPVFQPGNTAGGKVTRYFYGKPQQWELDQLFGNDVGYAEHYLKNMVVDPNGQASVSYINASGKTIATALAGSPPANLDALPSVSTLTNQTVHLLKPDQFKFDYTNLKLTATTTYLAAVTGTAKFDYNIQKLLYTYGAAAKTICSNCYFDLNIRIVNSCNPTVNLYPTTANDPPNPIAIGVQIPNAGGDGLIGNCTDTGIASNTFTANFSAIGEYYIVFEFVMSRSVMEKYLVTFLQKGQELDLLNTEWFYLNNYLNKIDFGALLSDCHTASQILGTKDSFRQMFDNQVLAAGIHLSDYKAADATAYHTWVDNKWDQLNAVYNSADYKKNCLYASCEDEKKAMEQDLFPGGQYALFDNNFAPLETDLNVIYKSWRTVFPVITNTQDPVYQLHTFTKIDGKVTSANDASINLADLVRYFKPEWAALFLGYHPEACKLTFCNQTLQDQSWDAKLNELTIKATDIPGIPDKTGAAAGLQYSATDASWLLAIDPFFSAGGLGVNYHDQMKADLDHYSTNVLQQTTTTGGSRNEKNLLRYIDYVLYCSASCNTDACWNSCSPTSCTMPDRNWIAYRSYYLQLKKTYYNKLRSVTACSQLVCDVGTQYTAPSPASSCADASDFAIRVQSEGEAGAPNCSSGSRPVVINYGRGNVKTATYVYLYYGQGIDPTGLPTSVTFPANTSKAFFCLRNDVPVNAVQIKAVNCTGTAPPPYVPPGTPNYVDGDTVQPWEWKDGYGPAGNGYGPNTSNDFSYAVTVYGNHESFTVKISLKPNVTPCPNRDIVAYFWWNDKDVNNGNSPVYQAVRIDPVKRYGTAQLPNLYYFTETDGVNGSVACPPDWVPPTICSEALLHKISRFDQASKTDSYADYNKDVQQANSLLADQLAASCEGHAFNWMKALAPGLSSFTTAQINTLRQNLVNFCAANGDFDHPFGASTYKPDPANPGNVPNPKDFGQVIKNSLPGVTAFTDKLNPWLLDGPAPYTTKPTLTVPAIRSSSAAIKALLDQNLTGCNCGTGGTAFYNYLVNKYGNAMTLSQEDLTNLQNASAACNYLLPQDVMLPIFLQPGGCITPTAYANAKAELNGQFTGGLSTSSPNYLQILTNFMNQKFGYALSFSAYQSYDNSPTGSLCNNPPYKGVKVDLLGPMKSQISTAAANAQNDYQDYINTQKELFRANYISTCASAQAGVDLTTPKQNYHFTLYYYDQAENLIRTIPPEGVSLLSDDQIAKVQQARDNNDVAGCGTGYTGPTTTNETGERTALASTLGSGQSAAVEFWFYNAQNDGVRFSQTTTDGQYRFQVSMTASVMNADIYYAPLGGNFSKVNHYSAGLTSIPPLQAWNHVVVQAFNLLTGQISVYVNGYKVAALPGAAAAELATTTAQLKHVRFYNRLLNLNEIWINANNNCFLPLNTDGQWYRFNIPTAGGETTVAANSQQETKSNGVYPNHVLAASYVYNTLNNVIQQSSPDGGTTSFWYDLLGRVNFSQNAKQLVNKNFSYTIFDKLGRVIETGQKLAKNVNVGDPGNLTDDVISNFNTMGSNSEIVNTFYDVKPTGLPSNSALTQNNLRKRVSAATYRDTQTGAVQHATYYNYDIAGNVSSLWQLISGLDIKQVDYEYDLISGKVNFVRYQGSKPDNFFYQYKYDAENRLTEAWSGTSAMIRPYQGSLILADNKRLDAAYSYYLHGPLARVEFGDVDRKVQGLDYAYTLQGWLKGVNNQSILDNKDIGLDGYKTGTGNHPTIAGDAYAYSLAYFAGDYKPVGATVANAFDIKYSNSGSDLAGHSLYDGNISNSTMSLFGVNSAAPGSPVGYTYQYDQLSRLKKTLQHTTISVNNWNSATSIADYQEDLTYDGNGNILTAQRNGPSSTPMDRLSYVYSKDINGKLINNKLSYVDDTVLPTAFGTDIDDQAGGNFRYDEIGNLIFDQSNLTTSIGGITWMANGKLQQYKTSTQTVKYSYDPLGNRVSKSVTNTSVAPNTTVITYYIRDTQGNPLAVYDNSGGIVSWREQDLYGLDRMGIWKPDINMGSATATSANDANGFAGLRFFELGNHLGNVMSVITDKRIPVNTASQSYSADIVSAQDYYPFGMIQPGRTYQVSGPSVYRYGFNGKENDNDIKKDANTGTYVQGAQQDYGMRIYDPRLGRFLSMDPIRAKYPELTPYQFASNTPIQASDLDGLEADFSKAKAKQFEYGNEDNLGQIPGKFVGNVGIHTYNGLVDLSELVSNENPIYNLTNKGAGFKKIFNNAKKMFSTGMDYLLSISTSPEKLKKDIVKTSEDPHTWENVASMVLTERFFPKMPTASPTLFEINVDLMGGARSALGNGWINFDIAAQTGIADDIGNFSKYFKQNSVNRMVVNNPQADFLPFVSESLGEGSTITVRGQVSNKFFKRIWEGKAEGLSNFEVIPGSKKTGLSTNGYFRTDGTPLGGQTTSLNEIVLKKKK
ncbi:RHS repeat-associated core domain-containing protein [Mucilaginibacter sp. CAU 1740]|uniref:RHS repeat-associated core domain-containing protein n=1 Tax=Mucilaginibacter sp. CAU 1740 TaxID=3140365 RepID=UPI00325B44E6